MTSYARFSNPPSSLRVMQSVHRPKGFCPFGSFPPIRAPPGFSASGLLLSSFVYARSFFTCSCTSSKAWPLGLPMAPVTKPIGCGCDRGSQQWLCGGYCR